MTISITAYASVIPFIDSDTVPIGSRLIPCLATDVWYVVSPDDPYGIVQMSFRGSSISRYHDATMSVFGDEFDAVYSSAACLTHDTVVRLHESYTLHPTLTVDDDEDDMCARMHDVIAEIVKAAASHPDGGIFID